MSLRVNGHIHSIGQLGPDFLILDDPAEHPPVEAEIVMSIDGREKRWTVYLLNGIQVGRARTAITRCVNGNGSTVSC